ncbi:MAG TPA: methionyl-tRNA formyltransferase [Gemmatimonadales bacterium]|nr:methionyl-tRNA formyltransferase [Gemmatimonadales bacterium]
MRVVFFGTPLFAARSLLALLEGGIEVAGVVTQPDRPRGRSHSTLVAPPVKEVALASRLPVLQPERPLGDVFLAALRHLRPELGVVVAYGHILRPPVLQLPPRGMINLHASLLPELRGAAPINWAILNGAARTGVSVMQMEAGMDSGPVYQRVETPIGPQETAGELTTRLADLGARALLETVQQLEQGPLIPAPQDDGAATFAPKIERAMARLDWGESAPALSRRVRAFDPAPGAWSTLDGAEIKFFGARTAGGEAAAAQPGTVLETGDELAIATGNGVLRIAEVQPAGRKRLGVAAWARGRGAAPGQRFT